MTCVQNPSLLLADGDDHHLDWSDMRRQNQAIVIAVDHDYGANKPSRCSPRGLMRGFKFVFFAKIGNPISFGKAGAKIMGSSGLEGFPIMHQGFDCVGSHRAGKGFMFCLFAFQKWDGKQISAAIIIDIKHPSDIVFGVFPIGKKAMTLLPKEFGTSQKRTGRLFPTDDGTPLIVTDREVSMRRNGPFEQFGEEDFGSRPDNQWIL